MSGEAHVRIDEGIKRGPKKPRKAPRHERKADLGSWVIPKDLNPHSVIECFLTETTTSHIASEYGLSRKALVKWLRETVPIEWKEAQVIRALCRKEDGEDGYDSPDDALSLACAREKVKSAQWDLERLDSGNYGAKQEVKVTTEVTIEAVLDGAACALLAKMTVAPDVSRTAIEGQSVVIPTEDDSK